MNKLPIIIGSLILAMAVGLGGCVTVNVPNETKETPTLAPPQYHTFSFTLQGGEVYSFPIYLRNNERLHLIWSVENSEWDAWFHITTPSGVGLGFYDRDGQYADGTLSEGFCRGMAGGITQFSPSDYDWGEGYYTMMANKYCDTSLTVKVEYWIED